jgi:hypothetical protein
VGDFKLRDRLLSRRVTLGDGSELRTVGEALALIAAKFSAERAVLEPILLRALQTGKRADVGEATLLVENTLRDARLTQAPIAYDDL